MSMSDDYDYQYSMIPPMPVAVDVHNMPAESEEVELTHEESNAPTQNTAAAAVPMVSAPVPQLNPGQMLPMSVLLSVLSQLPVPMLVFPSPAHVPMLVFQQTQNTPQLVLPYVPPIIALFPRVILTTFPMSQ
jgi:hypothetical protein